MSVTTSSPIALSPPPSPPPVAAKPTRTWLVGPWFDLLFLANLGWLLPGTARKPVEATRSRAVHSKFLPMGTRKRFLRWEPT